MGIEGFASNLKSTEALFTDPSNGTGDGERDGDRQFEGGYDPLGTPTQYGGTMGSPSDNLDPFGFGEGDDKTSGTGDGIVGERLHDASQPNGVAQ